MATITAVVPTWNRCDLLVRLLESLRRQIRAIDEILVVDNGSDDSSARAAQAMGATVLQMGCNTGFARAVNRGIREARGDWVAILNNDVELDRCWLGQMVEGAERYGAWFATGKLYQDDTRRVLDGTFDVLSRAGCAWRCGHGNIDGPLWSTPRPIASAPFTAALFRKALFHSVGFLDERLVSYLEDVEFGIRCAVGGFEGRYVPEAVAYHLGSATLGRWHPQTVRQIARNQVLLVALHYPHGWWRRLGWPVLVGQVLWGMLAFAHGAGWAFLSGKAAGVSLYRRVRRTAKPSERLEIVLSENERCLQALQQATGFDKYWRWYFALT